ncbi:MAG: hypothetical protein HOL85_08180 [Rhodospirillaceae bacterium]|jgi:hypothetical protein|nr:hypothetical protein [Rhodospirillaceae bacterium]
MTDMTEQRLSEILAAYGADPKRWPEHEREAATALVARSHEARMAVAEEAELDASLDLVDMEAAPSWLAPKIGAVLAEEASTRPLLSRFWPFGTLWTPAAGLVAAALLGMVVGTEIAPAPAEPGSDPLATIAYSALGVPTQEYLP